MQATDVFLVKTALAAFEQQVDERLQKEAGLDSALKKAISKIIKIRPSSEIYDLKRYRKAMAAARKFQARRSPALRAR